MKKSKGQNMHLLYCQFQLVLETLDNLKVTAPRMIELKQNIIEFCELINNEVADTYTVQKSTYFQDLTNKIDTVIRKNFNSNM